MITTVLFDVGTTLLGVKGRPPVQYSDAARELVGFDRPPVDYEEAFDAVMREHGPAIFAFDPTRVIDDDFEYDRWRRFSCLVFDRLGLDTDRGRTVADALIDVFATPETWTPFPDTWPTLNRLRARDDVRIGIVSNWSTSLRRILEVHDLIDPFEVIIGSCEEGIEKPDPAIFLLALDALGTSPAETIYVGDSLEADVAGAHATGMTPLLIDRRGRHVGHPSRIESLVEVAEALGRWPRA